MSSLTTAELIKVFAGELLKMSDYAKKEKTEEEKDKEKRKRLPEDIKYQLAVLEKYKRAGNIAGHKILRWKIGSMGDEVYYSVNVLLNGKQNLHFEQSNKERGGWAIISDDAENPTYGRNYECKFVNKDWTDLEAAIKDIEQSMPQPRKEDVRKWGFDLTSISPANWRKVLREAGAKTVPVKDESKWVWEGKDVTIFTMNDPITGKYCKDDGRTPEVGYASYIGIEGDEDKVKKLADMIRKLAEDIKDESPKERQYI